MTPGKQKRSTLYDVGGINPDEERIGTRTPNAKPQTPNAQRQTLNTKRRTPNPKRQTPNPQQKNMKLLEPDTCPRCGKSFHCSKSAKCWCYEVETSPSLLEHIQENYNSCLCPDCLKSLSEKSKG